MMFFLLCILQVKRQIHIKGMKKASNRIKAVLAEQGKTNNWLAEQLGMNKTTVSKWCRNQMQPTMETLFEIAEALNVDVRTLLVSNKQAS
ncbi:DNA-binding transcriptional regulator, XRE-family HTH domain [Dyadobacter psychrophilus]|uniref:DNA-binding transcriptional regulator, XRE-family HTH domain n=2 Tax=Dyadobacter psychrophilus TaxID=651661 RepID=A0A1T5FT47_9BACT|nr:DNA-binding transcriptional regulator, XRE-family HTH domain [Dyadobacter psychrophilus]